MADILCFPQERNVGKARHVAQLYIRRRTEKDRTSYWNMVCGRLAGSMHRAGFSEAEIERQIAAFLWAVECEIYRITNHGNHPGGAA